MCWILLGIWSLTFLAAHFAAGSAVARLGGAISMPVLLLIVILHCSLSYGWAGVGAFFAISYLVGLSLEASSIYTGFPFGFYTHSDILGPKVANVPLLVPLGYFFLGYLAWSLARLLARDRPAQTGWRYAITTPLVAAFLLPGYDVAMDPIAGTVQSLFAYRTPIGYFGVPLTNFLGWIFNGWLIFQLFALVETRLRPTQAVRNKGYWLQPCIIWGVTALQFPAMLASAPDGTVERAGRVFVISDIYTAAVVVSLMTMVFAAIAAASRLAGDWRPGTEGPPRMSS